VASLLPLRATVAAASANLTIDSSYPFADGATVHLTTRTTATTLKLRIPAWANHATVDGVRAPNGTLAAVHCPPGTTTTVRVELSPSVVVERGWGDVLAARPADAVAVVRGPLVYALHPRELRTVVRSYATTPAHVGEHAPDYLIRTDEPWNYALDLSVPPAFNAAPSVGWSLAYPFDDSGRYPHTVSVTARRVPSWGYWRGSNITAPPPVSPLDAAACGPPTTLTLVPFGSTNSSRRGDRTRRLSTCAGAALLTPCVRTPRSASSHRCDAVGALAR
jgi:hypothetical protein